MSNQVSPMVGGRCAGGKIGEISGQILDNTNPVDMPSTKGLGSVFPSAAQVLAALNFPTTTPGCFMYQLSLQ